MKLKIRSSIISLAAIEMTALLLAFIYGFVVTHRKDPSSTSMGLSGLLAALFLSAVLDVAWIVSFEDDYPLLHVAWVMKQFVQLFFVLSLAFYSTALSLAVYYFIAAVLITIQLVLWRVFIDTRRTGFGCDGRCADTGYVAGVPV